MTLSVHERLSELRDILYSGEEPSPRTWEALCVALDGWATDDSLEAAFDYIQLHLDAWPDALRLAPRRWWDVVRGGGHEPRFRLARHLKLAAFGGGAPAVAALLREPFMAGLTRLDLSHNRLGLAEARALAGSAHLGAVRALDLGLNVLGDAGVAALTAAPFFPRLQELDLTSNGLEGRAGDVLAEQLPAGLEALNLWGNSLGALGAAALAAARPEGLRRLDLGSNSLGYDGALALASAPWMAQVTHLNLSNNKLPQNALEIFARSPFLGGMQQLNLLGNGLPKEGRSLLERANSLDPDAFLL